MENKQIEYLLSKLIAINSIYPNEEKIGNFIFNFLKKNGYHPQKQIVEKNRFNLLVEKGKGKRSIVLYSHLDTVGITKGWITNPFQLVINKDRAFGLGAWDMKGGMAVNIQSFFNYQPKNIKLKLVFCVDEENISKGAYKLIKSGFIDKNDCLISTEPAFKYGHQGIVIGRIGRAVYQIEVIGESKHLFYYSEKFDVNIFVSNFLLALSKLNQFINQNKKQFIFARKIQSESIGMSLPEKTIIELDSAILPPATHKEILKKIKKIAQKINKDFDNFFKINIGFLKRETPFLEGYEINKNNYYLKKLVRAIKIITRKKAITYFRSSVADENVFAINGFTVLGIGPEGGSAHSPNEWVSLNSLRKLYNILIEFFSQIDKD